MFDLKQENLVWYCMSLADGRSYRCYWQSLKSTHSHIERQRGNKSGQTREAGKLRAGMWPTFPDPGRLSSVRC